MCNLFFFAVDGKHNDDIVHYITILLFEAFYQLYLIEELYEKLILSRFDPFIFVNALLMHLYTF